jgi:hypothetical protein
MSQTCRRSHCRHMSHVTYLLSFPSFVTAVQRRNDTGSVRLRPSSSFSINVVSKTASSYHVPLPLTPSPFRLSSFLPSFLPPCFRVYSTVTATAKVVPVMPVVGCPGQRDCSRRCATKPTTFKVNHSPAEFCTSSFTETAVNIELPLDFKFASYCPPTALPCYTNRLRTRAPPLPFVFPAILSLSLSFSLTLSLALSYSKHALFCPFSIGSFVSPSSTKSPITSNQSILYQKCSSRSLCDRSPFVGYKGHTC